MHKKILQKNEKILRKIAEEVPVHEIKTTKIKKILREMSVALKSQSDGVAIAAPQIGHSLRIFIVSNRIFAKDFDKKREENLLLNENNLIPMSEELEEKKLIRNPVNKIVDEDLVFINPKISKLSREKEWVPEGCLSVRPFYGKTFRSKKVMLAAYDKDGKKITRGASGLLAQIFQHETDHLNGILFIDHAKDVKKEIPQNKLK